jgi:hypothetical protein
VTPDDSELVAECHLAICGRPIYKGTLYFHRGGLTACCQEHALLLDEWRLRVFRHAERIAVAHRKAS